MKKLEKIIVFAVVTILFCCHTIHAQVDSVSFQDNSSYASKFPYRAWRFINWVHQAQELQDPQEEIVVAIIHTSNKLPHPDLKGIAWENEVEINGKDGVDDDGNGWIDDIYGLKLVKKNDYSRSISLAGIVAGVSNYSEKKLANKNGKIKILPIAAYYYLKNECDSRQLHTTEDNVLEALDYAKRNGASVVLIPPFIGDSKKAIEKIRRFPGIVVTWTDSSYLCNPKQEKNLLTSMNFPNLVKVGFQNTDGTIYHYQQHKVDLAAVGRMPMIDYKKTSRITESFSFPAAMVAGAASILKSSFPKMSNRNIKGLLVSTVDQNPYFTEATISGGTLNVARMVIGRSTGGRMYNGDWARIHRKGPSSRDNYAIALDQPKGHIYLYGGSESRNLWRWNGSSWKQYINNQDKNNTPATYGKPNMIFDEKRERLVLLDSSDDLWQWENGQWNMLKSRDSIGFSIGSYLGNMILDPVSDRLILLGMVTDYSSGNYVYRTFEFDWSSWKKKASNYSPSYITPLALKKNNASIIMEKVNTQESHANGFYEYMGGIWKRIVTSRIPGAGFFLAYNSLNEETLRLGSFINKLHKDSVYLFERGLDTWIYDGKWTNTGNDMPLLHSGSQSAWCDETNKFYIVGMRDGWHGAGIGESNLSIWQYSGSIKPTWIDNLILAQSDYNNDGKADFAIWHPGDSAEFDVDGKSVIELGSWGNVPVPGDYDGDGKVDFVVCQRVQSRHLYDVGKLIWRFSKKKIKFGHFEDIPVPLDYDNDGKTDIAVFRKDTAKWYFKGKKAVAFGNPADLPVPADYNGDGRPELATYTPLTSTWHIQGMGDFQFGKPGDSPVPADYDGDGRIDIATWNPRKRLWLVMEWGSGKNLIKERFGSKWDIPVPGDYNEDGKAQLATYTPMKALWNIKGQPSVKFGSPGDVPLVRGN